MGKTYEKQEDGTILETSTTEKVIDKERLKHDLETEKSILAVQQKRVDDFQAKVDAIKEL